MLFSPQIPLQLQPPREDRLEDFVPGNNQVAIDAIRSLSGSTSGSLFIYGPPSSGKSHLLSAACTAARSQGRQAWYIGLSRMKPGSSAALQGLKGLVCFDDLHAVVGNGQWEEALFHCFNQALDDGGQIVVSSRQSMSALEFSLPDLASRVAWGTTIRLEPLSEDDRCRVLRNRARQLEVELPDEVLRFLIRRLERDLDSLLGALETLCRAALANKRRLTVPFAREVLQLA